MYTRDFPCCFARYGGKRYKSFFGVKIKITPKCIFIYKNGLVEVYRNIPVLHEEINFIFKEKIKQDSKFFANFISKELLEAKRLESIAEFGQVSRQASLKFADDLCAVWEGIYASLYIPTDKTIRLSVRNQAMDFRRRTER